MGHDDCSAMYSIVTDIARTKFKRDKKVAAMFKNRGWTVIRIWECELRKKNRENPLDKIKKCS